MSLVSSSTAEGLDRRPCNRYMMAANGSDIRVLEGVVVNVPIKIRGNFEIRMSDCISGVRPDREAYAGYGLAKGAPLPFCNLRVCIGPETESSLFNTDVQQDLHSFSAAPLWRDGLSLSEEGIAFLSYSSCSPGAAWKTPQSLLYNVR